MSSALSSGLKIKGIDLNGFMVKDAARAMGFYRDVLGLEPNLVYAGGRGAEYELPDGSMFGLWGGGGALPFQPSNGILFAVEDLDAAVASLKARDIPLTFELETPNCRMAGDQRQRRQYRLLAPAQNAMIAALDGVFSALADPTRRRIIERLTRSELTAGEIAAQFAISQPAISKHLKVLERSGLLKRRIIGREHHLRLAPRAMRSAFDWMERQERYWNESFDRLDEYLAQQSKKESST